MKPHIKWSHGGWVVYWREMPVYRAKRFRTIVAYLEGLGYNHWGILR